jgi:hypothetical protein
MTDSPMCERCGGATHYAGNVTAPNQTIYGCDKCGRQTWVKARPQAQQQQPQPKAIPEK